MIIKPAHPGLEYLHSTTVPLVLAFVLYYLNVTHINTVNKKPKLNLTLTLA